MYLDIYYLAERWESVTLFLQEIVVGVTTGAIYALIALGYTMVYGIIELINFAHGDIFMIGTFICISIFGLFGITNSSAPPTGLTLVGVLVITLLGAMVLCAVLGMVIERVAYRPLRNAPRLAPLISAIGVSLILEDIGKLWKGFTLVPFPQIFPQNTIYIGPVSINSVYILVIVVALVLMVALQWMVTSTRVGRAMRAVAQDREAAALMGVNVNRIIAITFLIGGGLAGAAALIWGLAIGNTNFTLGFSLGLFAFTAAVLGGIGNLVGAMLGGVLIGLVEAMATFIPDSTNPASHGIGLPHGGPAWHEAIIFLVLILILVFRPSGLLGQQTPEKV
jgi:branched-chain amino acid transport system permease protein